ncbi:hypothetical protein HD596_006569 [Nonomuraea jabiensis]|uniref:Uncharacterized protein n=1 Tax=Nonomuraea jabiensis TaxID=882448 RepID=A0A7W9G9X9_9ACTN|nr:hypothetical protein [Nonomuraea jabiensis]
MQLAAGRRQARTVAGSRVATAGRRPAQVAGRQTTVGLVLVLVLVAGPPVAAVSVRVAVPEPLAEVGLEPVLELLAVALLESIPELRAAAGPEPLVAAAVAGLPEARATMVSCWPRRLAAGGCRPVAAVKGVPGAGGPRRATARRTGRRATPTLESGRPKARSPRPMRSVVTGRSAVCGPSPKGRDPAEPADDVRQPRPMEVVRHPEVAVVVRRPGPKAAVRGLRRTAAARRQRPEVVVRRQGAKAAGWWLGPMAVGQCWGPRTIDWPTTARWTSGPTVDFRLLSLATGRPMARGGRGSSRVRDGVRRPLTGSFRCSPTWVCHPRSSG